MARAFQLARLNHGLTGKNPSVGCILMDADGHVVGAGVTAVGGSPHAEEIALEEAGTRAKGATAFVTLEPCRERTSGAPSCSSKLVSAGIARVVVAIEDPHPTARNGVAVLRRAGIQVQTGLCKHAAARLYRNFFAGMTEG